MTPKCRLCVDSIELEWTDITTYGAVMPTHLQAGTPTVKGRLHMPGKCLDINTRLTTAEAVELHALLSRVSERVTREIHDDTYEAASASSS
jgi:hypothetical protein